MFEDSLLESGGRGSRLHRRGPWATVFSFALQSVLVGLLILAPLVYTDSLPRQQLVSYLVAPPPPPPPPPPAAAETPRAAKPVVKPPTTEIEHGQLKAPTKIPEKVAVIKEEEPPPSLPGAIEGAAGGVAGGVPGGIPGGVIGGIPDVKPAPPPPPPPPPPPAGPFKVSAGVTAGMRERMVNPVYPPMAKAARISGRVILQAVIGKNGSIEQLKALSGHPMLIPSAIDAVRQWRYKPYYLNGQPVAVDTQVTVNFVLSGSKKSHDEDDDDDKDEDDD